MYTISGIDWDAHWYRPTLRHYTHLYLIRLSVCMSDNINKHRPGILKFSHNLSDENSLNARFINNDNKIKF